MKLDSMEMIERVLAEIPSCIFLKDLDCKYVFATHYWKHLNGSENKDFDIAGKTDIDIRKDKDNARKAMEADRHIIETGESLDYTIREETDGVVEYLQIMKRPVRDKEGKIVGIVGLINDITKQMELEQQLKAYMDGLKNASELDPLTKIGNRSSTAFIDSRKEEGMFCLFDVDKFKKVNDTFGHDMGDKLLAEIAKTMKDTFRDSDTLIRLGGDEFAIFAYGIDSEEIARRVLDRFFENIKKMQIPEIKKAKITVSMGVFLTKPGDRYEMMYKLSDEKMYIQKKKRGGDGYLFV